MRIAFGKSPYNPVLTIEKFSFEEFAGSLRLCRKGEKREGYFIRGGNVNKVKKYKTKSRTYKNIHPRGNKYLNTAEIIVIDGDESSNKKKLIAPKKLHRILKRLGYAHIVYTSYSHSKNKTKFRVVIPCKMIDEEYLRPSNTKLIDELNHHGANIELANEMNTWSQPWFFGTRENPDDGLFEHYYSAGKEFKAVKEYKGVTKKTKDKSTTNTGKIGEGGHFYEQLRSAIMTELNYNKERIYERGFDDAYENMVTFVYGKCAENNVSIDDYDYKSHVFKTIEDGINKILSESEEIKVTTKVQTAKRPRARKLSKNIIAPKGSVIGEIARAFYKSSVKGNWMLAGIAARTLIANMSGGKYIGPFDSRVNVQIVALGETSLGKNVLMSGIRNAIQEVFKGKQHLQTMGAASTRIVGKIGSVQGLEDLMAQHLKKPDLMLLLDEFGKFVTKANKGDALAREILTSLLMNYSDSNQVTHSRVLANGKGSNKRHVFYAPNISLCGASTPSSFVESLEGEFSADGSAGRMLIFDCESHREERRRESEVISLRFKKKMINNIVKMESHIDNKLSTYPEKRIHAPVVVKSENGVDEFLHLKGLEDDKRKGIQRELYGRRIENVIKLSMISAIAEDPIDPEITMDIAINEMAMVNNAIEYAQQLFKFEIGEGKYDTIKTKVLSVLFENKEKNDGYVRTNALSNCFKGLKPVEKKYLYEEMESEGLIEKHEKKNLHGRPTVSYKYLAGGIV